ncbi:MAG: hypothetical protein AVDCRST_MAG41-4330, partial [uncultured Corynebacteriales bacterium]
PGRDRSGTPRRWTRTGPGRPTATRPAACARTARPTRA